MAVKELSERLVRSLLNSAPDATIIVDQAGKIIFANAQVAAVFGYPPEQLIDKPVECLLPERFRSAHPEYRHDFHTDATARPMGSGLDLFALHRDGHEFPVEISLSPVHTEQGTLTASSIRDATATRELQRSLTGILERSLNEIYIFDATSLRFVQVNRGARANLGYTMEELRQLTPLDLKPEYNTDSYQGLIRPLRDGSKDKVVFTTVQRRKDGSEYPVEVHLQHSNYGSTPVIVAIILDITERKASEQKLLDADRRKSDFLAVLAHELRNPLAPIFSSLEIIKKTDDQVATRAALATVERQAHNLRRLVDDLIDVSRIDHGKLDLQMRDLYLDDVINIAIETSKPLIDARGHKLTVELPRERVTLYADLTRLAQAFTNLLTNAAKYTSKNGHIVVSAAVRGNELEVSVQDNGFGISAENARRIFEMFSQFDEGADQFFMGLGVGLPLAKWLVEKHQGSIIVTSAGKGKGSIFTVKLPIVPPVEVTASELQPTQQCNNGPQRVFGGETSKTTADWTSRNQLSGTSVQRPRESPARSIDKPG
jgi:PAS domain S-box-containing protein